MTDITMYTAQGCSYCNAAERLLRTRGVDQLNKIRVDLEAGKLEEMMTRSGRRTVPQIFIGSLHVGGFDELSRLDREGRLEPLLRG
ncbi:glutaredoxin 3 [Aromatoleum toluclasticum]|uniref:glutaredoxin 3 n=1 Tax=Aromatoleum toluclasticum TaxID=92003 RepID=UPI001D18F17A|nr:glutaredoxin 3 [Aromatoleum toluclasticum]MCC4118174.1 glutaredoxin 3 [Aromatoleum toluclasticum]